MDEYYNSTKEEPILRDYLAAERTHLANEELCLPTYDLHL